MCATERSGQHYLKKNSRNANKTKTKKIRFLGRMNVQDSKCFYVLKINHSYWKARYHRILWVLINAL